MQCIIDSNIATEKLPPVKEGGGYASEILKPVKLAWWQTEVNRSDSLQLED